MDVQVDGRSTNFLTFRGPHRCLCLGVNLLVSHSVAAEGPCPLTGCRQVAEVLSCHRGTHGLPSPMALRGHSPSSLFSPS